MSLRMRVPLIPLLATLLGAGLAPAQDHSAPGTQPSQVVDVLNESLTGVMKDAEALGYSGRFDRLSPVIHQLFDLDFMTQKIAGRHWKSMSPEDRERLQPRPKASIFSDRSSLFFFYL